MVRDAQGERSGRRPPRMDFAAHPSTHVRSLAELLSIALAIETEAVRRYRELAAAMARRGEAETSAVFADMALEEDGHIRAIQKLAAQVGCPAIQPETHAWRLPPEFAESWDRVAGSALLTAYRALAIAVDNEQRAFSFYTFIAAEAEDAETIRFAEVLAQEELNHAALLRKWRRAAYRRGEVDSLPVEVTSPGVLDQLIAGYEQKAAGSLIPISHQLTEIGAIEAAAVLRGLIRPAGGYAEPSLPVNIAPPENVAGDAGRIALLNAAQKPLEQMAERLERAVLESASEEVRIKAANHLADVLQRLASLRRLIDDASTPGT
ncbi:rubrerythrin [Dongia mobilis]|uniref:Rubrerythrin n=2 Tax=Dongia mobilis TaxID=578943 RepID=A0A4R6WTE5_9PROT|nr:rubrerythrin [Dongia mobilis]